jgi:hypothetical protein
VTAVYEQAERPLPPQARYNASDKGQARKAKYRRENSKWETDARYLAREFLAWDGEGITNADGSHSYVMLANSEGGYLADPDGLSTPACFSFILSETAKYPGRIHVIYGGGYDFNCWLADLNRDQLADVYRSKKWTLGSWAVSWRKGKSFYLTNGSESVTVYDVIPFFQCAFIKACDDYLGTAFVERDLIVKNKALRSSFAPSDIPEVRRYNDAELANLVLLVNELRSRLNKVGLRPRRWDGPGAIASALLTREGVKNAKAESPAEVARASRYAYAGGRFEVVRFGHMAAASFEYDVNSAYPSALRDVPNLSRGTWTHHHGDAGNRDFALYYLHYSDGPASLPGPLFSRSKNGTICYPRSVSGWYWTPEYRTACEYAQHYGGSLRVAEVWEFVEDNPEDRPFHFIEPLYLKRLALKKAGDGAHVGLKLALNSLYGKLAQQVGWTPATRGRPMRIPPFHQLEWAGYTTSHCRATVLRAGMEDLTSVIAFETDALFTSKPLAIPCGRNLGEFERTDFADLTYVQSGMYFGTLTDGTTVNKTRGVDRGTLTRAQVVEALQAENAKDRCVDAELTRFIGAGFALAQNFDKWRRWETSPRRLSLEPQGKRAHYVCESCGNYGLKMNVWHTTVCPFVTPQTSCEFPIEWINPDPAMTMLSELREGVQDYDC